MRKTGNRQLIILLCFVLIAAQTVRANSSRISFNQQQIFVNGLNLAWGEYPHGGPSFANDIGPDPSTPNRSHLSEVFDQLQANGANCMRLWLHTNGAHTPEWKGSMVIGPGRDTIADLKQILDMAWERKISIIPCLWSFDMLRKKYGHKITDRAMDLLQKPESRQSYIDHSLIPMVTAMKGHPAILAWEVFNEPEGMSHEHGWQQTHHVPMASIQAFVNLCAGAIHRTDPNAKVTNGAVGFITCTDIGKNVNYYSDERLIRAGGDPNGWLDFYSVHYYDWLGEEYCPFMHPASHWKLDKPIVIAEFYPNCKFCTTTSYKSLYQNGYAGALAWSWTDVEPQTILDHIRSISTLYKQDVKLIAPKDISKQIP